ncbi:MAG: TIGR01777 family oxidoreductase [Rikenellaceae bacterium]|nr:TIGR01777 family oxidoreductase [Rikenellaceae bacterium]
MGDNQIKSVAISGASGFVGSHLAAYSRMAGVAVYLLDRELFTEGAHGELLRIIGDSDIVINLAGTPINRRWTEKYRRELIQSRLGVTRSLVDAIGKADGRPRAFFSASAVGIYAGDGCNGETEYKKAKGFLSELCQAWETEAQRAESYTRTVIMRFGLVLSPDGGVLERLIFPTLFKTAVVLGNGRQHFPWIGIEDIFGAIRYIAGKKNLSGVFNFVAPQIVTNREFTRALADRKHSWIKVNVPGIFFKALYGEASSFILCGQCVVPQRLICSGYEFLSPDLATFLKRAGV